MTVILLTLSMLTSEPWDLRACAWIGARQRCQVIVTLEDRAACEHWAERIMREEPAVEVACVQRSGL